MFIKNINKKNIIGWIIVIDLGILSILINDTIVKNITEYININWINIDTYLRLLYLVILL